MKASAVAKSAVAAFALLMGTVGFSDACTRFTYEDGNGGFMVGRSMDWGDDPSSDLYIFPAGMKRDGGIGENSLEWTSTYGSVIVSFYDIATVDGMNEAGLVGNHLYLAEADYGEPTASGKPAMSIGAELQ